MTTEVQNIQIAQQWFAAFNDHNLEDLLALYTNEAQHFSPKLKIRQPETQGWVKGKDALRAWWKDSFDRLPGLQYIPTTFTANEERVIMEYLRKTEGEPDLAVAEVLEIEDCRIYASRVYHG